MTPQASEVDTEELEDTFEEPASFLDARRLGQRVVTAFSVFVTSGGKRVRARAAEVSTTGVLVDFRHSGDIQADGLVTLELAVPGLPRPIRAAARLARYVGRLYAFEFMIIGRDERLTLAEYIDRIARPATTDA